MSTYMKGLEHPFEEELDDVNLFCQRCSNFLCYATQTTCKHVFCRPCIEEYLLYFDECPTCKTPLRWKPLYSNICLDSTILAYLQAEPQSLQEFQARFNSYRHFRSADRLGQLRVGMQIDVRDIDYVWTTGTIKSMHYSESSSEPQMLLIQYRTGLKEQILIQKGRLAPLGTNTSRRELPHYSRNKILMERNGVQYQFKEWKKAPEQQQWRVFQ